MAKSTRSRAPSGPIAKDPVLIGRDASHAWRQCRCPCVALFCSKESAPPEPV